MPYHVSRTDFDSLVEKAVAVLPEEFKKYFTNITIMVEDYPSKEDRRLTGSKGLLLGLFKGVPYTRKGGFFDIPYPLPDTIILFQKNIEDLCSSEKELIEQITKTLIHEVGHYFGLSEKDLTKHGI
ncbi:MAG: metallopeptidase family protein [Thermodesulfovibrionales bacterium]|nr:metallopeptidase family protein [Thermodesulfovibrionales bacterium]